MTIPVVYPTVGGRGPDPEQAARRAAAAAGPTLHLTHLTSTTVSTQGSWAGSPREAFNARAKRLREAKTAHTADPASLTLTWEETNGPDRTHVTLTYAEPAAVTA